MAFSGSSSSSGFPQSGPAPNDSRFPVPFATGWWWWFRIFPEFHHPLIGAGVGTAAEHHLVLDHENDGIIRRHLQIEFPEFREQRAEVTVQPARELRLIRLMKLVEHPPRIVQIAQGLLIVFLDLFPDAVPSTRTSARQWLARCGWGTAWPWVSRWARGVALKSAANYHLDFTTSSVSLRIKA
jgi:hypothetical protein